MASRVIVDRIEGGIAVLELGVGRTFNAPLCMLPTGTREGSVLTLSAVGFELDADETRRRTSQMRARTERLFGKGAR
jgi:hypothetical protein